MVKSVQPVHSSVSPGAKSTLSRGESKPAVKRIVLAGNPNVGKSAIFNALTGLNADVSNYPGTTIDVSRGKVGNREIIDTPGIYGVSSFNDEERIARQIIVDAELIINVVSALSLDRDLFLTLQLIAMGKPLLLVINQWDEAKARGLRINVPELSSVLGVPIVTTVATRKEGISDIVDNIDQARVGRIHADLAELLHKHVQNGLRRELVLLALEGDEPSAQLLSEQAHAELPGQRGEIYRSRRRAVNELYERCVQSTSTRKNFGVRLGRLMVQPVAGSLIALTVCYFVFYQLLGIFVAGTVVDFSEKQLMRKYYEPALKRTTALVFPCDVKVGSQTFHFPSGTISGAQTQQLDNALRAAPVKDVSYNFWAYHDFRSIIGNTLSGEYGIFTLTVTYLLALLLPLVVGFYMALALLEDSGYLPRLAVLVDRLLNKVGLNGRAIIPLILGLGCVTMATVTTRLLSTRREKVIASALLGIAIPCSAQLGIVSGTLARCGGFMPWLIYGAVVGGMLAITGVLLNMVMPGKSQALIIDLPPMRMPRWDNVLKKTWTKSWNFMQESVPMFCLAGLVVSIGQMTGFLDAFISVMRPITVSWLHLPDDPRVATTFALGIVRRDFAAFGLTDVAMNAAQAVVAMIVITLFVPCIATVGVMIKERGFKTAMAIWVGSWICAFVVGGILAQILPVIFHTVGS
jgi:ferrous iron transport protein B